MHPRAAGRVGTGGATPRGVTGSIPAGALAWRADSDMSAGPPVGRRRIPSQQLSDPVQTVWRRRVDVRAVRRGLADWGELNGGGEGDSGEGVAPTWALDSESDSDPAGLWGAAKKSGPLILKKSRTCWQEKSGLLIMEKAICWQGSIT